MLVSLWVAHQGLKSWLAEAHCSPSDYAMQGQGLHAKGRSACESICLNGVPVWRIAYLTLLLGLTADVPCDMKLQYSDLQSPVENQTALSVVTHHCDFAQQDVN